MKVINYNPINLDQQLFTNTEQQLSSVKHIGLGFVFTVSVSRFGATNDEHAAHACVWHPLVMKPQT